MAHETESSGGGFGDAFFIIGIFLLIFFVWTITGGPNKAISQGGFAITSPKPLSSGEAVGTGALLNYRAPLVPGIRDTYTTSSRGVSIREQQEQAAAEEEATSLERSSYTGLVSLSSSTSGAKKSDVKEEYVRIDLSSRATAAVNISGWKLVSGVTDISVTIPFGTELPLSGLITEHEAIFLKPGDDAYLLSGRSPIGASFRVNSCMGYFEQYQTFYPSLPGSCPSAQDEFEAFAGIDSNRDDSCLAFVKSIPRCSIATSIPPTVSYSCKGFVETNINYNGCVKNHQNDNSFADDQCRVYLGRTSELWKQQREVIRLYDNVGKLVDQISY